MKCLLSPMKINLLKIALIPNSKPSLINMIKVLKKRRRMNGFQIKTTSIIETHQKITGSYQHRKTVPLRSYQTSQWNISQYFITTHCIGEATKSFNRLIWTAELKQQNSNLKQDSKGTLIRSKLIMWKLSPPLTLICHPSIQTNLIFIMNI